MRVASVDLWRVRLHQEPDELARLSDCLHLDERDRASRFRARRDRDAADLALVAVSGDGPVGVDIERVQSSGVVDSTSGRVLSSVEREELRRLSGRARCERFTWLWARKEAYNKADGRGLQLPLDLIDVATSPDRVLLREQGSSRWTPCSRWILRDILVDPDYAAAVAAEGSDCTVVPFTWTGA